MERTWQTVGQRAIEGSSLCPVHGLRAPNQKEHQSPHTTCPVSAEVEPEAVELDTVTLVDSLAVSPCGASTATGVLSAI